MNSPDEKSWASSFSSNNGSSLDRYKRPTGPSKVYDIDGYALNHTKPQPYEPKVGYK
jgi:hypothetical protein